MNDSRSVAGRGATDAPDDARRAGEDAADRAAECGLHDPHRRKEEFRTWLFLSLIMAPILAVLIVSGYGFLVWMYQLLAGPPGS